MARIGSLATRVLIVGMAALVWPASPAKADERVIDIGGSRVRVASPEGWCFYSDDVQEQLRLLGQQIDTSNVMHTFFGDCGQVQDNQRTGRRVRDFGIIMTPTVLLRTDVNVDRAQYVAAIIEVNRRIDVRPLLERLRERMNAALPILQTGMPQILGLLATNDEAAYLGQINKMEFAGEGYVQLSIWGSTLVRRRVVNFYLYQDMTDVDDALALLKRVRSEVARLVALNADEL